MPRKVIPLPEWIPQACELMVKDDLSLPAGGCGTRADISIEEAEPFKDRKHCQGQRSASCTKASPGITQTM